jgi:transposase-like protein
MVMVLWAVLDCNVWLAETERLLSEWPTLTGRTCPDCKATALVGHGRRRRSLHSGRRAGRVGPVCEVIWFWVQRLRCKACGRTHTLLPGFVARYQRHSSGVRERATALHVAGRSWGAILKAMALPMLSASSPRRWVAGVLSRCGAATLEMRRWVAAGPVGAMPYAPVTTAGSWDGFLETVGYLLERDAAAPWPREERVAGTNWLGGRRRHHLMV